MTKLIKFFSLLKSTNSTDRFMTCAVSQADAARVATMVAYS